MTPFRKLHICYTVCVDTLMEIRINRPQFHQSKNDRTVHSRKLPWHLSN